MGQWCSEAHFSVNAPTFCPVLLLEWLKFEVLPTGGEGGDKAWTPTANFAWRGGRSQKVSCSDGKLPYMDSMRWESRMLVHVVHAFTFNHPPVPLKSP